MTGRAILHVDMDAFFASIAQLDDPSLRGRPVLTGGTGKRGVVTSASYEARPFGCRSAMPMAVAKRLCPHAVAVKVPGQRIREMSAGLFDLLDDFSPLVQPLSVDEAFLDVTGSDRLMGDPVTIAQKLRQRIRDELGLTASVGVSFNKFLAKLASDLDKPDGLTVITPDNLDATLLPLPVSRIWGIGPAGAARLERMGVKTVADLRRLTREQLDRRFGELGERFHRLCRGLDDRPVVPDHQAKSIGHETTFGDNRTDPDMLRQDLLGLTESAAYRLRRRRFFARGVTLKLRFDDFTTITRSATLDRPTDLTDELYRAVRGLFDKWADASFQPVRLIGFSAGPLTDQPGQLELFEDPRRRKQARIDQALDGIADRFGAQTVHRGAHHHESGKKQDKPRFRT